jgi:regulator of sigma D
VKMSLSCFQAADNAFFSESDRHLKEQCQHLVSMLPTTHFFLDQIGL